MTGRRDSSTEMRIEALDIAIKNHADGVYRRSSDLQYAQALRLQALAVRQLIDAKAGEVKDAVVSQAIDMRPILDILFGKKIEPEQAEGGMDYTPTVIEGIYGRIRLAPGGGESQEVSLDLAAKDSI